MTDIFTKEKRSEIMRKIRCKDTKIEREFAKKHPNAIPHPDWLPFKPDFIIKNKVVFLDSPFWHGIMPKHRFESLPKYWKEKLFRNIVRDFCAIAFYESIKDEVEHVRMPNPNWLMAIKKNKRYP